VNYGNSGNRTFCINQSGDIVASEYSGYSGRLSPLQTGAAFLSPATAWSITGNLAVGTVGGDGRIWRQVN
jgi:hypothetical protein